MEASPWIRPIQRSDEKWLHLFVAQRGPPVVSHFIAMRVRHLLKDLRAATQGGDVQLCTEWERHSHAG
jgi:hypothetical protein